MKLRFPSVFLFLFLICTAPGVNAQTDYIRFENLSIRDGLSQSSINTIIQDHQGFIWLGTQDGLNKYDGYKFTIFKHNSFDETTLSNNYIHVICEDAQKKLWIGTDAGLNMFDPVTGRFQRISSDRKKKVHVRGKQIKTIVEDHEGTLWVGAEKLGIAKIPAGRDTSLHYHFNYPVERIFQDSRNIIWIGTQGGGLYQFDRKNDEFIQYRREIRLTGKSISSNTINDITEDRHGNLWLATNMGLNKLYFDKNKLERVRYYFHSRNNTNSLSDNAVSSIVFDSNDRLWVGITGNGLDKITFDGDRETFVNFRQNDNRQWSLVNNLIYDIYEDDSGTIWVGTNNGVSKFDPQKQGFVHYNFEINNPNSLIDPNVWTIFEDNRGLLWVGTREGLNMIDRERNRFYHYKREANNPNSLNNNSVLSIHQDPHGTLWIGAVDGLFIFEFNEQLRTGKFKRVKYRDEDERLDDQRIYALAYDKRGFLWVGSREGLSRLNIKDFTYQFFRNDNFYESDIPDNVVRAILIDEKSRVWIGSDNGGLARLYEEEENFRFKAYLNNQSDTFSISNNMVPSIWECSQDEDVLWIGTYGGGINRFHVEEEKFIRYTEEDGLPNNAVYGVLGDDKGNLWMSTNRGLSRFNIKNESFKNFEENDGLQSNEFNIGAYSKSASGEMYFGGINGFNAFYPSDIKMNMIPPKMVITNLLLFNREVTVDSVILNRHISLAEEINLNYKQNNITFEYAALHYSFPEKNQYKYIMEELETDTTFAGTEHKAHYTNLSPGEYTFKVWGANSDGIWAKKPASIRIIVTPPFWATWWFRGLVILLIGGTGIFYYRSRLITIKKQKERLEQLVRERTKEIFEQKEQIESQNKLLEEEKIKTEKLLLNILPEETAEELKSKGKASARNYRKVSVMFTDIKGFTRITEKLKAAELVSKLDSLFIGFDEIIQKYNIEKIKTIGDSYMCAGGLPIRNKSNPIDIVLAGLEIQRYMKKMGKEISNNLENPWKLRLGIHTGDVTAGVIGTKRFAYDIWGDTVNIASRMEESGEPDMVNISGKTYELVEPFFVCTYRGKIPAKNKGHIDMYFVHGIKPELSVDGKGLEPNDAFWDYVNLQLYSSVNYRKAERYIVKILRDELPDYLHYHNIAHMEDVCAAVERLAHMEGIKGEDLYLLKSAALYHDAGFTKQYDHNEPIGVEMAKDALPKFGYTEEQIQVVTELILVTQIPHQPKNHLEEIICDADLDYLGRDDFHEIADRLRRELKEQGKIDSDRAWDEIQVKFLSQHNYFTKSAILLRQKKKEKHIEEIKERIKEDNYVD